MIDINIDKLLNFALDAGKLMLQSGGETYRVEDTITMICKSFGFTNVEVFASPTTVIATIYNNNKVHTAVKRITSSQTDLYKVHCINALSREVYENKIPLEVCEKRLKDISNSNSYSFLKTLLFAGISTSTFTVLFDGGLTEFICAFFIGIIIKLLSYKLSCLHTNEFFINTICGGVTALLSILCLEFGFINSLNKLVAGSIMLLVPGLAFTNALRDLLEGELVSGVVRLGQVFFIGLSIALGTGYILHCYYNFGGFLI